MMNEKIFTKSLLLWRYRYDGRYSCQTCEISCDFFEICRWGAAKEECREKMQKESKQRLHEENMTSKQIQVSGVATFEIALSRRFPCSASTAGMESRSVNSSSEQATTSNTFIVCALRIPSFLLPNSFKVIQAEHVDSGLASCGAESATDMCTTTS